jgi:guanylate kinase
MKGKLLIFSAPSGSGKTTVVQHLIRLYPELEFSISATSRKKRNNETDGKDYYFLSVEDFRKKIENQEFIEWEEVYKGQYYGTLKMEVERIRNKGSHVVFDVDVVGGLNIKKLYGNNALAVFVKAPSVKVLEERLRARSTEDEQSLKRRIEKSIGEMSYADKFDCVLVNDRLDIALLDAEKIVADFLK